MLNKNWNNAELLLKEVGLSLINYTIVFLSEKGPFGTGVLTVFKEKRFIVTASHVAKQICQNTFDKIGIAIKPDNFFRQYPLFRANEFVLKFWEEEFSISELKLNPFCKDLAVVEIPHFLEEAIYSVKEFVRLIPNNEKFNVKENYFGQGIVNINEEIQMMTLGISIDEYIEKNGIDYLVAKSMKETFGSKKLNKKSIRNFQGYSGGGLFWKQDKNIYLVGIAYYQDNTSWDEGFTTVNFHGPKSLRIFLESYF